MASGSVRFTVLQSRSSFIKQLTIKAVGVTTFPDDVMWLVKVVKNIGDVEFLVPTSSGNTELNYDIDDSMVGKRVIIVAAMPQDMLPSIKVLILNN